MRPRSFHAFSVGLVLLTCLGAEARPVVTGPEVRAFLGGRTGKLVYLKNYSYRMYYLDFDDSVLQERPLLPYLAANPMISWDGSRVLYERYSAVYIQDLTDSNTMEHLVYAGPASEPHWWVQPQTGNEYVTYTQGSLDDWAWPPQSGAAYILKLNGYAGDPPTQLIPYMMSTGRSHDGNWGATSHHSTGMYRLDSSRVDTAFLASKNWMNSGSFLLACNASINPTPNPSRQNRMMHLTSGQGLVNGTLYDNHQAVFIRSWNDPDIDHPFWYMGIPGDNCNNDSSGNLFWGFPEWSTDEDYFTATGSKDVSIPDSGDLYIVRIDTTGPSRILRVLQGDGINFMPHLWVKGGLRPARIRLDRTSLSFATLRQDSTDPPPDTLRVSNAGDAPLPPLSIFIPAVDTVWLKISVLNNGSNAPRIENRVVRAGVAPGSYNARVVVSYGSGVDSAVYTVSFLYSDPVLTTLLPKPRTAVLVPGDTARLTASPFDQLGQPFTGSAPVFWSGSAGLQITGGGQVTTDSSQIFQSFSAFGISGSVACTTTVVVVPNLWRYAADTSLLAQGWRPDSSILGGFTREWHADTAVLLDSLVDPAPAKAYRAYRKNPLSFRLAVPNNRYHLRLHFSSLRDSAAPATAALLISLEGRNQGTWIEPIKPFGAVGASIYENDVTVSDGDGLLVGFAALDSGGFGLAAVEAYAIAPTPVLVTSPNGGEKFYIGDSLIVRWTADTSWVRSVGVQLSVDSGRTWSQLTRTRSVGVRDADWGRFAFLLPITLDGNSLLSTQALVSVYEYFGADRDRSDAVFSIGLRTTRALSSPAFESLALRPIGGGRFRMLGLSSPARITVTSVDGRRRTFTLLPEPSGAVLDLRGFSSGLLALQLRSENRTWRRLIVNSP